MKLHCKENLYLYKKINILGALLGNINAPGDEILYIAFEKGKDCEIFTSVHSLQDGVISVEVEAVGEEGLTHTLFSSEKSKILSHFILSEAE